MTRFARQNLVERLRRLDRQPLGAAELSVWAAEVLAAEPVFEDEVDRESLSKALLSYLAASPLPSSADLPELIGIVQSLPCQHYAAMERLAVWLNDDATR